MVWEYVIPAAASVISGLMGKDAAESAADAQVQAGQESNALQRYMFDQGRADLEPWRAAGRSALERLTAGTAPGGEYMRRFGLSDFEADQGYQFRMSEGLKGLERAGLRSGGIDSGPMLKGFMRFGQGLGSQEYGNAYNRFNTDMSTRYNYLAGLSGTGQTTAQQVAGLGSDMAYRVGDTMQTMGASRASGYLGGANALSGALQGGYNNYLGQKNFNMWDKYLNRNSPIDMYGGADEPSEWRYGP